jgi:hypothetical protein
LKKKSVKDIVNACTTLIMDIPHHVIPNGRWYTTWFITVEKLCPLKEESLKENEEALDLRTKSYKSTPKMCCKKEVISRPPTNSVGGLLAPRFWKDCMWHKFFTV